MGVWGFAKAIYSIPAVICHRVFTRSFNWPCVHIGLNIDFQNCPLLFSRRIRLKPLPHVTFTLSLLGKALAYILT
jgi:hypothetical protein